MLWLVTFRGKLYNAPVKDPKNVLDIATGGYVPASIIFTDIKAGTGIWAIEFGRTLHEARTSTKILTSCYSKPAPQF